MRKIKPETIKDREKRWEDKKIYPSLNMGLKHLPEAKNWKIGNRYAIKLELKMRGLHDGDRDRDNGYADFDIVGIEPPEGAEEKRLREKFA